MILTCPNCNSQFKVTLATFGTEGRNVKCSACKETWFHDPEDNDSVEVEQGALDDQQEPDVVDEPEVAALDDVNEPEADPLEEVDDFSEAIEAIENSMSEDEIQEKRQLFKKAYADKEGRILAYVSAGVVFVLILLYLLINSTSIMNSNPGMQGFYKFFGINMVLPDIDTLAFEGVKAERDGDVIIASGRIVNLSTKEWPVPMIEITVLRPPEHEGGEKEVLGQWIVSPPESALGSEKELHFEYMQYIEEHKAEEADAGPHTKAEEHEDKDAAHEEEKRGEDIQGEQALDREAEHEDESLVFVRVRFVIVPTNGDVNSSHEEERSNEGGEEHEEAAQEDGGHGNDPNSKDAHEPPANH